MTIGSVLAAVFGVAVAAKTVWIVYLAFKRRHSDEMGGYVSGWGTPDDPQAD